MKAVIIGGGIAGLAAAIGLKEAGWEVVVKERVNEFVEAGLGFIILPNGLEALDELNAGDYVRKHGRKLCKALMRTPDGVVYKEEDLLNSIGVKRSTCVESLMKQLPPGIIQNSKEFSHFLFDDNDKAIAAIFKNGEREYGDIFIAADGAGSIIRSQLFPKHPIRTSSVKELVGIADTGHLLKDLDCHLLKTQSETDSLSLGLLPCNEKQVIWYMQFDGDSHLIEDYDEETKKQLVKKLIGNWPDPIGYILKHANFKNAFVWSTRDMELLPAFHYSNIVLTGDSAHLALPFTSQGTSSALMDGIVLSKLLAAIPETKDQLENIFTEYYDQRRDILNEYLQFGRKLEHGFLHPSTIRIQDIPVPLAK
ncbi:MAG: hypothetical protein JWN76_3353 [Chitinophagaceae bacterium]|nr:hypothetical protein [Chitinophagaceae bacterium]